MGGNRDCTVYVGNLDEKVSDKVLYEILIQAGRVVDLHIPRDKETNRHKGFAFAEYETVEIADYAVRLFSGLVTLYNRTLKFAMSGQDKSSQNMSSPTIPTQNPSPNTRPPPVQLNQIESSQRSCRFSAYPPNYAQQAPSPPGVVQPHGYVSKFNGNTYDYGRRAFGAALNGISHSDSSRKLYDSRNPVTYPSY